MPQTPPTIVGLGELLWDEFPDFRRPGGAPANVAFDAGQLGCRGVVASRVGTDERGDALLHELADLDLAFVQRDPKHPTGRVTVDVSDPGHPDYVIHEQVAWDYLEADGSLMELASRADAICFGTLGQRSSVAREAIQQVLGNAASRALIVFDVNLRQSWYDRDVIERSLNRASIAKLNRDETLVLAEMFDLRSDDPAAIACELRARFELSLICVTRAAEGCLLIGEETQVDQPGIAVDVVDAVGAGDAFTAALIVAQLEGWPLDLAAEFANRVGALVAGSPGAMPPLADAYRRLRAELCGST